MDLKRICILGTPRCGSQYVSQLIAGTIKEATGEHVYNMLEPFTESAKYIPVFEPGTRKLMHKVIDYSMLIEERVEYVSSILKECDPNIPLVMKLFPYESTVKHLDKILNDITDSGFKFIHLKRTNLEQQLISYALSSSTNKWTNLWGEGLVTTPVTVQLEPIAYLYNMLTTYNISDNPIPVIRYENCLEDLSTLLNRKISISEVISRKQKDEADPYRFIINADDVKQFIQKLINGN